MKIKIECLEDLQELVGVLDPTFLRAWQPALSTSALSANIEREMAYDMNVRCDEVVGHVPTSYDEPDGLPTDIAPPAGVVTTNEPGPVATDAELPELDADGVPHNTDWHSEPAKINADGRWRARRKRDEDAYKAWLLEQSVFTDGPVDADEADPVATETHALPQDEGVEALPADMRLTPSEVLDGCAEDAPSAAPPAPASAVDLEALIAASLEAAQDASDSHVDLLNACRDFTSKHGHPAFTALKAAVAPDDAGGGKAVQHFTPGERRLMQACIANYPSN